MTLLQQTQPRTPGLLIGTLGDAFLEPLPEEELQMLVLKNKSPPLASHHANIL